MTPIERVALEQEYLIRRAQQTGLKIALHVRSTGACFDIAESTTGRHLLSSAPVSPRDHREFQIALDRIICVALLAAYRHAP